jgi:hypothetical protein
MNPIRSRVVKFVALSLVAISLLGSASAAYADEGNGVQIGSGCATECGNDCNYVSWIEVYCLGGDDDGTHYYLGPCCSCA